MLTRAIAVNISLGQEYDVRIDRRTRWGNPFAGSTYGRARAIDLYRAWIIGELRSGAVDVIGLAALHGQRLGCWCSPADCHGDVLAELAELAWLMLYG